MRHDLAPEDWKANGPCAAAGTSVPHLRGPLLDETATRRPYPHRPKCGDGNDPTGGLAVEQHQLEISPSKALGQGSAVLSYVLPVDGNCN